MGKSYKLPELLVPELKWFDKRLTNSIDWVQKNKVDIHPSIPFIQAVELYDMGIDVVQLKPNN